MSVSVFCCCLPSALISRVGAWRCSGFITWQSVRKASHTFETKAQRRDAGGRKSEQPPNDSLLKPLPVQRALGSIHQQSDSAAPSGLARDDPQPSQIRVSKKNVITLINTFGTCAWVFFFVVCLILLVHVHVFLGFVYRPPSVDPWWSVYHVHVVQDAVHFCSPSSPLQKLWKSEFSYCCFWSIIILPQVKRKSLASHADHL